MLIEHSSQLDTLCARLSRATRIAVDTETNGLHAYRSRVCIIQFSDGESVWLLDVVAFPHPRKELEPVIDLLAAPAPAKILHGSSHDISSLKEDFSRGIGGVFDTYVAAQLLSYDRISLSDLVERHFGVVLSKKLQKKNWAERPLKPDELDYLRHDVTYLLPLHDILRRELEEKDLLEEAELESRRVEETAALQAEFDPDSFWRMKGIENLGDHELAFLKRLFRLRDEIARRWDRPPFKTIPDGVLIEAAAVREAEDIARIRFFTRPGLRPFVRTIQKEFRAAREEGRPERSRPPKKPRGEPSRLNKARREALESDLKAWRNEKARERGVPPGAVLPNHLVEALIHLLPSTCSELDGIPYFGINRSRRYSSDLLGIIRRATEAL